MSAEMLLELSGVSKRFTRRPGLAERIAGRLGGGTAQNVTVRAVNAVDLTVRRGEVVGIVGESGCGKSTLGRMVSGITVPSDGHLAFDGAPVATERRGHVVKTTTRVQMIHQDPFASLNPRRKVGDTIAEGPRVHGLVARRDVDAYVREILHKVGLGADYADRLPHQFSGGQRQRVAIARALAMRPDLLVLDEPVASLDVSIQAQVLNLFQDLRASLGLTALFVSHDLGVVRHVSDRVAIMYLGRIVELGSVEAIYRQPLHPYTQALFESVPRIGAGRARFRPIQGEIPSPIDPPAGCTFHPRCPHAGPRCRVEVPKLKAAAGAHEAACHLHDGGTGGTA
ncbi:ABC transporter ATP-binding protein [Aureimonas jatrophae]|uniref:Peptide/nickel transport system ATP-binding protein n=1 Tax=Aureimonas jatrophae TaxID=1166073 RepID=A0A1H0HI42_9HYPH|nr:oligopeptide/dipeptide ABC transporter ATP-binding protein [Aureimonas jatrophae]MBB3950600.1 peptide/nickel transport system ATP-binding protein [Aureimonas jatrophae]SDO18777.1 peptide/nickel transport system ATP-binding protein [Aureimonas jatrophae]